MDRNSVIQASASVGLYIDGLQSLNKLPLLWEAACSMGFDRISVDVFAWAVPNAEYTKGLNIANFVSDSVMPLVTLCKSVVLRVMVPESYNVLQKTYLDDDLFDLRLNRVKALRDPLRTQVDHCKLFCVSRTRPVVVFSYGQPEQVSRIAEQIISFVPDHPDSGHEIISLGECACGEFWIHIPIGDVRISADSREYGGPDCLQAWDWWHSLKASVNYSSSVGVMLELSPDVPSDPTSLEMWLMEPVRSIVVPLSIFCTGENGLPTLPSMHKEIVRKFLRLYGIQIFIRPSGCVDPEEMVDFTPYIRYLKNMHEDVAVENGIPMEPSVFPPMDTVSVNLDSDSYSAFELDERKYLDYERAVQQFLTFRQSVDDVPDVFVAAVVGCGSGPLVNCVLNAAGTCSAAVRIYALEKNPIAFATLQEKMNSIWKGVDIRLVMADMRHWEAPEQFDMILSEMLGSFGDNELCPEMLSGPERFLKADGVCIPQSYTSYLAPVSVPKIYELLSSQDGEATDQMRQTIYGYTVDSSRVLADPQPVFTFQHPSTTVGEESRMKSAELKFEIKREGVLHGFGGYFEASLYGGIEHSLVPDRSTPGLCSWNDIFFPLKRPVYVREREVVVLHFYRCRNNEFVWYEWAVLKPFTSGRHNINGKACRMSLQLSEPGIS